MGDATGDAMGEARSVPSAASSNGREGEVRDGDARAGDARDCEAGVGEPLDGEPRAGDASGAAVRGDDSGDIGGGGEVVARAGDCGDLGGGSLAGESTLSSVSRSDGGEPSGHSLRGAAPPAEHSPCRMLAWSACASGDAHQRM